jgi:hypothetical protein
VSAQASRLDLQDQDVGLSANGSITQSGARDSPLLKPAAKLKAKLKGQPGLQQSPDVPVPLNPDQKVDIVNEPAPRPPARGLYALVRPWPVAKQACSSSAAS